MSSKLLIRATFLRVMAFRVDSGSIWNIVERDWVTKA